MFLDLFAQTTKVRNMTLQTNSLCFSILYMLSFPQYGTTANSQRSQKVQADTSRWNLTRVLRQDSVTLSFVTFLKVWHNLVIWVPRVGGLADRVIGATVEPWVPQNVWGFQPLQGWLSEHAVH